MNASHLPTSSTETTPHRNEDIVSRLKTSQIFRDYQEAFETATGLPLVLRAVGSFEPPLRGSKQIASFCALMGGTSKTCAACLQLQAKVESEAVTECHAMQRMRRLAPEPPPAVTRQPIEKA